MDRPHRAGALRRLRWFGAATTAISHARACSKDGSCRCTGRRVNAAAIEHERRGVRGLGVVALNVVHPGPSEAEVSYPYEPKPRREPPGENAS